MDLSSNLGETVRITKEIVAGTDAKIPSPGERALHIWNILKLEHPELTDWDLACFAGEYLGMIHPVYPWIENVARQTLSLIYTYHYLHAERLNAESAIRREPILTKEESQSRAEHKIDGLRIVKSGEPDDGSG